ncbi:hypothetical protein Pcinc_010855 [Petrolisthes cinctipes]|uniref:Reverse transcriptase domain-containing protein n=1 Tax=Petrolisthes cinctipes TaxID=88211 RepID=A0AAE1G4I3_PETCI|nr:hypothetical protein Pcinc_010855 [Petrolisthes cinctipes]
MAPLSSIPEGILMPPPRPPDLHTPTTGVEVRMVERQLETSNKALATPRIASELCPKSPPATSERVLPPSDCPGACLQRFSHRWSKAPRATLKMLRRDFHWKWLKEPPPLLSPKLKNIQPQPDLDLEIQLLLLKGAIYEVPYQPCFISRIFLVPKSRGGKRLIIDLNSLNSHILAPYFHMHNHKTLADSLHPPAWMSTIDLKDAYLHVPIRQCLHKYLAFSFGSKLYFFRSLPFGLNVAPHIFPPHSKMASFPPTPTGNQCHRLFRRLGHLGHFSLIDSKGCQHSDQPSEQPIGFLINIPKSHLPPSTEVEWLGIRWFPLLGRWALPEDKQMSILSSIRHVLSLKQVSCRQWNIFSANSTLPPKYYATINPCYNHSCTPKFFQTTCTETL